jgi:hypothetical protein
MQFQRKLSQIERENFKERSFVYFLYNCFWDARLFITRKKGTSDSLDYLRPFMIFQFKVSARDE